MIIAKNEDQIVFYTQTLFKMNKRSCFTSDKVTNIFFRTALNIVIEKPLEEYTGLGNVDNKLTKYIKTSLNANNCIDYFHKLSLSSFVVFITYTLPYRWIL